MIRIVAVAAALAALACHTSPAEPPEAPKTGAVADPMLIDAAARADAGGGTVLRLSDETVWWLPPGPSRLAYSVELPDGSREPLVEWLTSRAGEQAFDVRDTRWGLVLAPPWRESLAATVVAPPADEPFDACAVPESTVIEDRGLEVLFCPVSPCRALTSQQRVDELADDGARDEQRVAVDDARVEEPSEGSEPPPVENPEGGDSSDNGSGGSGTGGSGGGGEPSGGSSSGNTSSGDSVGGGTGSGGWEW